MPFGLDEAASLASIVGFAAGFFEACIKGLVILSKARSYGRDVSGISLMIELELHKLHAWAVEAGLTRQPPELLVDAQYALMVPRILGHLRDLVSDLDGMTSAYGLQLVETVEQLVRLDESESAFERLGITANDGCENALSRIFKNKSKPWKVLKWVVLDEQKIRSLLKKVAHFIRELQQILDRTRQAKIASVANMLLRSAVLSTANEQDLNMIGCDIGAESLGSEVAAAARFKRQGLLLGVMDIEHASARYWSRSQTSPPGQMVRRGSYVPLTPRYSNKELAVMKLPPRSIRNSTYKYPASRFLARLDGEPVLLEFKSDSGLDHDSLKDRVCKVAAFLRHLDPSFHGLSCRGYVKVYNRYAYVFDLQEFTASSATAEQLPSVRTLRDLLDETSPPSLNLRLTFAITIMETLLQLHTSGWLHKEFRSHNVLFILGSFEHSDEFLSAPMRITGYGYARADGPQEPTEPLRSEIELDLYRHQACLQQPREHFRRAFDVFSVGCVLLEIGLWCSMATLCRRVSGRSQDNESQALLDLTRVRHELLFLPASLSKSGVEQLSVKDVKHGSKVDIFKTLEASMGRVYAGIVKNLIYATELEEQINGCAAIHAHPGNNLLQLEMDCLEKLRTIADVL